MTTTTKAKLVPTQSDLNETSQILSDNGGNKSKTIRTLFGQGWEKSRIARSLGIKYQFVRNVLNQPLKK